MSDRNMECDAIVHGSLIRGLQSCNLWPESSIATGLNAQTLAHLLQFLKIFPLERRPFMPDADHTPCSELGLNVKVDSIISRMSDPVQDYHRVHMTAQREKLQL